MSLKGSSGDLGFWSRPQYTKRGKLEWKNQGCACFKFESFFFFYMVKVLRSPPSRYDEVGITYEIYKQKTEPKPKGKSTNIASNRH